MPVHPHTLSIHFTLGELLSSNDPVKYPTVDVVRRLERLCLDVLEPLRAAHGQPLRITSGWRSPAYNQSIGGASKSEHVTGDAADLISGSDERSLAMLAVASKILNVGGLGYYPGRGFVHVDQRPRVAGKITTWMQVGGKYSALSPEVKARLKALGAVNI